MYRDEPSLAEQQAQQRTVLARILRVAGAAVIAVLVVAALLALWFAQIYFVGIG